MSDVPFDVLPDLRRELGIRIQRTSDCYRKRLDNIMWVERLPREGLSNKELERQIFIREIGDERLYIQYPGKESTEKSPRPWDFRPKLHDSADIPAMDLSFSRIWGSLYDELFGTGRDNAARVLAMLFYRMAFMVDCSQTTNQDAFCRIAHFQHEKQTHMTDEYQKLPAPPWTYGPPRRAVKDLSRVIPVLGSMSLEAFLCYNELLAWNEDCKYYYRDMKASETGNIKGEPWPGERRGRINTLLTHVKVLGFILNEVSAVDIFGSLSGRGVAPASVKEVKRICAGFILE